MNKRFKEIVPGLDAELMAPISVTHFNPADGSLAMVHHAQWFLPNGDGTHRALGGEECTVQYTLDQVGAKLYGAGLTDPVTGADLGQISAAGYALYGKAMFDAEVNEPSAVPQETDQPTEE